MEKITLLASVPTQNLTNRLTKLFENCSCVRGVVAFWAIPTNFFSSYYLKALSRPDSFYCVDIHRPTNIDALLDHVYYGANIYLHTYQLENYVTGEQLISPGLLHSKMILFDFENGKAELWIGSHNFSKRALKGINVEASVAIELTQSSDLYIQAKSYLENIKKDCHRFKLDDSDYYKLLQGNTSEAVLSRLLKSGDKRILVRKALDLLGYEVLNLHSQTIQLLGIGTGKLQGLSNSKTRIILQALDLDTNKEITYIAQIQQAGMIDIKNPKLYGESAEPRRYALIGKGTIAKLEKAEEAKKSLLSKADYFVNLKILEHKVVETYALPDDSLWQPVSKEESWIFNQENEGFNQNNMFTTVRGLKQSSFEDEQHSILKKAVFNKELLSKQFTLKLISHNSKQEFLAFYEKLEKHTVSFHTPIPELESKELKREGGVSDRRIVLY